MALNLLLKASDKKVVEQLFDTVFRNRNEEDIVAIVRLFCFFSDTSYLTAVVVVGAVHRVLLCVCNFTHVSPPASVFAG